MEAFLRRLEPLWAPHPGQRAFLTAPASFKVLACGRRWGKTDACAVAALHALTCDAPTRHLLIAPTADQARLLFDRTLELLRGFAPEAEPRVRWHPYPTLAFGPHRLQARSAHVGRSLRGHEATHIVVDEAAFLPEAVITEVALPMLAATAGRMTLVSTPNGRNHFWRFFEMGRRGENGLWSYRGPSSENPAVSREFLALQRRLIAERAYRVEYEAEFADGADQVFRSEAIERCLAAAPGPVTPPFSVGVDWARYGDFTAAVVLAGHRDEAAVVHLEQWHRESWARQLERIAAILERYAPARVLCDATGIGDPLLEALRARRPDVAVEGLVFTPAAKAELVDGLAWALEKGALRLPPEPELRRQLEHFRAAPRPSGSVRLEAESGYHDDLVIALALAVRQLPARYRSGLWLGPPRRFRAASTAEELSAS